MATQESFDISAIRTALMAKLGSHGDAFPEVTAQRFPHIVARITDLWASPELDDYLDGLMISDRDGRQGFPQDVAGELFRLISVHGALGYAARGRGRGWAIVDDASIERRALEDGAGEGS